MDAPAEQEPTQAEALQHTKIAIDASNKMDETALVIPPKFQKPSASSNVWLKSITSLAIYLMLGFYFFKRWDLLLLITAIVIFHELGHFFAMKLFKYNDLGIFFIPLLGAYVSGKKREVSQKESAVILLAGPLPGIILGILFFLFWKANPLATLGSISFYYVSLLFIFLNLFNLLPIYPLDGGQLLNRVFFNEENWLAKSFIILSIAALSWFAWKTNFPVLFIFPAMMVLRLFGDKKLNVIEKKIETEDIQTDLEYADLPDKDYWKIRNILIEHHPSFKDIPAGPPFTYDVKEEKVMTMIQNLLHRHLIQDLNLLGKLLVAVIWLLAIFSPWLLKMNFSYLKNFGF